MRAFYLSLMTATLLTASGAKAATVLNVDVNDKDDGIQNTLNITEKTDTFFVSFYLQNTVDCFSYQFSAMFDTTKLEFLAADLDMGMGGESNILKLNGGGVTGLSQLNGNNQSKNVIDFACTITGNDQSNKVNGSGLAGVAIFRNLMSNKDSTEIELHDAFSATFDGEKQDVDSQKKGKLVSSIILSVKGNGRALEKSGPVKFSVNGNKGLLIKTAFPLSDAKIMIMDIKGRIVAGRFLSKINDSAELGLKLLNGTYIYSIKSREISLTGKVGY